MKILNLGIDNSLCDKKSITSRRIIEYGELVEKYDVIVPGQNSDELNLSQKVTTFCIGGKNKIVQFFSIYKKAKQLLQDNKYDLITIQDPFELSLAGWILSRKYNIGLNIQEHGDFFSTKHWRNESLRNFYRYYLGKFLIKRADSVRVVSEKIKNTLLNDLKINENKSVVVPVYTELKVESDQRKCPWVQKSKVRNDDKFVFLWMGRFVKQKNLDLLTRAFKEVSEKCDKAVLRLVGRGEEKEKIVDLVKELKIKSKVEFIDWVDDIYFEYDRANAYVLSSNYEGWGRVIVEALQSKLPILMTEVGCARELIKHEKNALIASIGDLKRFSFEMERLYNSEDLRNKFIKNSESALKDLKNKKETLDLYLKSWERAIIS